MVARRGKSIYNPSLQFVTIATTAAGNRVDGLDLDSMRLIHLLHRVSDSIVYDLESAVHRRHGLSWGAFRLLHALWVLGSAEPSEAARQTGMSRPAVTALTRTLERRELVERLKDPRDGRRVKLALTSEGHDTVITLLRLQNERETDWLEGLSEEERDQFLVILLKLLRMANHEWVVERL